MKRKSSYELLRIFSMFFIVFWHVIRNNIGELEMYSDITKLIAIIIQCIIVVHVNSFVLITGYFYSEKNKTGKAVNLFIKSWFYKALFATIFFITGAVAIEKLNFILELLPLSMRNYWFINCYLILLFLSPFLSKLVNIMTEKEHKRLIIISLIIFSFIAIISNSLIVFNNGYNIIHFIVLFLIGAYLKKYPIEKNYHFTRFSRNKRQLLYLFIFILCVITNTMIYYFSNDLMNINSSIIKYFANNINSYTFNYNNPIIMLQSIAFFLFFGTLSFSNKLINKISSYSLGIYLVHDNCYLKDYIYHHKILGFKMDDILIKNAKSIKVVIYFILFSIVIYIISLFIEILLNTLMTFIGKRKIFTNIKRKTEKYIEDI